MRKIKTRITCACLQVLNFVSHRQLKLHAISRPNVLVFPGHPVYITWRVSCCYKIVINQHLVLPGYITQVHLDWEQMPDILEVQFFGYGRRLKKSFMLQKMKINLAKNPRLTLPPLRPNLKAEHTWPGLQTLTPVLPHPSYAFSAILLPAIQLPSAAMLRAPVLNLQLEPYYLQPNQPDYETTVL